MTKVGIGIGHEASKVDRSGKLHLSYKHFQRLTFRAIPHNSERCLGICSGNLSQGSNENVVRFLVCQPAGRHEMGAFP